MRLTATILSLALLAGSGVALAGAGNGPDRMARMQSTLDLTDEQVAEMRRIRDNGGTREEIQAVLTDEQRAKAEQMRQAHGKRGGDKLARMQQHLGLSDEQVAEMRSIRDNGGTREEMHAVLTDEQRAQLDRMRQQHGGKYRGDGEGKGKDKGQGMHGSKGNDGE